MPLLLNVLQNANSVEYGKLRLKAMECAGLIGLFAAVLKSVFSNVWNNTAIAVGRDIFRPDANAFVELLMRIQSTSAHLIRSSLAQWYLQIAQMNEAILCWDITS